MVKSLLTAAGFTFRRNRFPNPPAGTYAVWMDDVETDGPDCAPPSIYRHNITVEVYEPRPDDAAEAMLEAHMTAQGLHWSKQDRYWIQQEQMYQTIYEFTYIEKRRT